MRSRWSLVLASLALVVPAVAGARKKPAAAAAAPKQASAQTARAIGELTGKFKWGISSADAIKIVTDGVLKPFDEQIQKESDAFKQDKLRKKAADAVEKVKDNYIVFDGHKTGWDVSLIDREFGHNNEESMLAIMEKDQRRFLFFWHDRLYKEFIAFNAAVFEGKNFDDFADIIQRRYGTASVTFRKQRSSDEQTFDHLEWPPAGDTVLWAIDMTTLYNNFCLKVFQKSTAEEVEKARPEQQNGHPHGNALVDAVTKPGTGGKDENADIVDEITGRQTSRPDPTADAPENKGKHSRTPAKSDDDL